MIYGNKVKAMKQVLLGFHLRKNQLINEIITITVNQDWKQVLKLLMKLLP